MSRASSRAKLHLTEEERGQLEQMSRARKAPLREIQRSQILLHYARGRSIMEIASLLKIGRPAIYKCVDKALAAGVETALKDKYHKPKEPVITEEAKGWVTHLACTKPTEHGYAAEIWSLSSLARHARNYGVAAGHVCLEKAAKATIQRILKSQVLQPHKVRYYLEKRDPQFEPKMREVLMVYKEIALNQQTDNQVTVSVDEKPGIQAVCNVAPDLPPQAEKHPQIARDYEYKRLGTLSLLAALDLQTGHVIGQVHPRHRSREFVSLLKELDTHYAPECTIRVILDNHSAHISKETMSFLATRPNRFVYVHTPKHGSWLNLVETLFGKMARTFLKHIRVQSLEELKERILKGIAEINAAPVVHRWKKFELAQPNM